VGQVGLGGGQDLVEEKGEKHRLSSPYCWLKVQKDLLKGITPFKVLRVQ